VAQVIGDLFTFELPEVIGSNSPRAVGDAQDSAAGSETAAFGLSSEGLEEADNIMMAEMKISEAPLR
jgi:hypothetical protein